MNTIQCSARLLRNGLRYRFLKYSGKPYRIESISLELTHRCMCRCRMCNIWQIPDDTPELNIAEWLGLLSSSELKNLRELDLTGGEPFLRKDVDEILRAICDLKQTCFPRLRTVSITTNGILTDRILEITKEILPLLRGEGIDLVLACGMDGIGELHDRIRNFPGTWKSLDETLTGLRQLRKSHPNLILGVKTTIQPLNARELDQIAGYAEKHHLFTIISPRIITPNRFGNRDREEDLRFSQGDIRAMLRFFEGSQFAWSGHRQALLHYLRTGKIKKPCSAGFNNLFVRYDGEVFACPVIAASVGNIRQRSLEGLFRSADAGRFRKKVGSFPACGICTEPGMERIALPLEGFTLLRLVVRRGPAGLKRIVGHMGLDKYL